MATQAILLIHGSVHHRTGQPILNLNMTLTAELEGGPAQLPGMIRSVGMMTGSAITRRRRRVMRVHEQLFRRIFMAVQTEGAGIFVEQCHMLCRVGIVTVRTLSPIESADLTP